MEQPRLTYIEWATLEEIGDELFKRQVGDYIFWYGDQVIVGKDISSEQLMALGLTLVEMAKGG